MTREPADPDVTGEEFKYEVSAGLNVAELITLPDLQRRTLNWMMRQQGGSVAELALHLERSETVAASILDALLAKGFVQEVSTELPTRYQVRLSHKRERYFPEKFQQSLTPTQPLAAILSPSGLRSVVAGSTFELNVTVFNKGQQSALIDIFIEEVAQVLYEWCVSPQEHLALDPGQNGEVSFQFRVPLQAVPDVYEYFLIVDAPQHYPEETPIQYSQRLQVLPPVDDTVRASDPTFSLEPLTTSTTPAVLEPGETLQIQVHVHNRSDRVDRFRLNCTDLPQSWFSVYYPESIEAVGIIAGGEGLELNPGDRGDIVLTIAPPLDSLAGSYFPTVRIYSTNNSELMLLDAVYLKIQPSYSLTASLRTLRGKVRKKAGLFAIHLSNQGNIGQTLSLRVRDEDEEAELCTYTLEKSAIEVPPKTETSVELRVKPKKWCRRPFLGPGLPLNFIVELEDQQQAPIETPSLVGLLLWISRPWWQFLGLVLTVLGAIALLILLIWLLFFRPPPLPTIQDFYSTANTYQAGESDFIRLSWQIRNPKQLNSITIVGKSPENAIVSQPVTYDLSTGKLPSVLKPFCSLQRTRLICRNVQTDAREPGDYIFTMSVFAKRKDETATDTLNTSTIKIAPIALPKIVEFRSPEPTYQAVRNSPKNGKQAKATPNAIRLNWKIIHPGQIGELQLVGRAPDGSVSSPLKRYDFSQGIPKALRKVCKVRDGLLCQNVRTDARAPGDYVFELSIIPKGGTGEPIDTQKTDTIKIEAQPIAIKFLSFNINGEPALPKYIFPINPTSESGQTIILSWEIKANGGTVKTELLPAPGTVPLKGAVPYPIAQKPGSETLTLQVTSPSGEQISRSVTIETFDPNAADPATVAAQAAAAAAAAAANPDAQQPGGDGSAAPPDLNAPAPSDPESLSPAELPPQFD